MTEGRMTIIEAMQAAAKGARVRRVGRRYIVRALRNQLSIVFPAGSTAPFSPYVYDFTAEWEVVPDEKEDVK